MTEHAVSFANDAGHMLHGILHLPQQRTHVPVGVVLMSPGQKCRVGPWRAYVTLARRLARQGLPVLRFDFHGIGDSEGRHPHGQDLVDFNGFVQTGGLAGDVAAATRFFTREAGVRHFVFAGLCGGASTGLIASLEIAGVYGQVLVDLPVTVSNAARRRYLEDNPAEILKMRPQESHGVLRKYIEKLKEPDAWRRLVSGESDYRLLLESAKRVALDRIEGIAAHLPNWLHAKLPAQSSTPAGAEKQGTVPKGSEEDLNVRIVDAVARAREQGQKLFFLNSSAYHPTFQRYFGAMHLPADRAEWRGMGLLVVPETNHVLSADHGQKALFETVEEFVRNALAELAERPSLVMAVSPTLAASTPR